MLASVCPVLTIEGVMGRELKCLTAAPGVWGVSSSILKMSQRPPSFSGSRFFISNLHFDPPFTADADGGPRLLCCVKRIKTEACRGHRWDHVKLDTFLFILKGLDSPLAQKPSSCLVCRCRCMLCFLSSQPLPPTSGPAAEQVSAGHPPVVTSAALCGQDGRIKMLVG